MKLKFAICDDQRVSRQQIACYIRSINKVEFEIDEFSNGFELIPRSNEYDIIILDIEMPVINGIEVAKRIREKNETSFLVFITSYTEFMQSAFKVNTYRYLVKPLREKEFVETISDLVKEINSKVKISFVEEEKNIILNVQDILYLEAFGDGVYIHTPTKIYINNKSLNSWMERLGSTEFIQVHKSYIVSKRNVTYIYKDRLCLKQVNKEIPIARRRFMQVKEEMLQYIEVFAYCR